VSTRQAKAAVHFSQHIKPVQQRRVPRKDPPELRVGLVKNWALKSGNQADAQGDSRDSALDLFGDLAQDQPSLRALDSHRATGDQG